MRKRIIGYSLVFILFFIADAVFAPFRLFGVGPSFLLSATVCIAMVEKERFGAIYGLVFGLFLDFASAAVFGVNALSFMIIGFIIGITVYQKIAVSFVGAFFLTSVSTVVSCCIIACAYTFFTSASIADVFLYICIPKIILTVPTVIVTYPIIKFMGKRFALHEEREGIW